MSESTCEGVQAPVEYYWYLVGNREYPDEYLTVSAAILLGGRGSPPISQIQEPLKCPIRGHIWV